MGTTCMHAYIHAYPQVGLVNSAACPSLSSWLHGYHMHACTHTYTPTGGSRQLGGIPEQLAAWVPLALVLRRGDGCMGMHMHIHSYVHAYTHAHTCRCSGEATAAWAWPCVLIIGPAACGKSILLRQLAVYASRRPHKYGDPLLVPIYVRLQVSK